MIKIYGDFLPQELAEDIHTKIYETPENWWSTAYKYSNEDTKYMNNNLVGRNSKIQLDKKVRQSLHQGHFTYRFTRSIAHVKTCDCYECGFNTYLDSVFKTWLADNTHLVNPERMESFTSVYDIGDFLSTHTDTQRGIAFIFNFTKDWKAEYGGMLHVDGKYYCPKFNSLTIMELPDGGLPHFVSEVAQTAPYQRVAISGWFNES